MGKGTSNVANQEDVRRFVMSIRDRLSKRNESEFQTVWVFDTKGSFRSGPARRACVDNQPALWAGCFGGVAADEEIDREDEDEEGAVGVEHLDCHAGAEPGDTLGERPSGSPPPRSGPEENPVAR